jgi:hypothetical protein
MVALLRDNFYHMRVVVVVVLHHWAGAALGLALMNVYFHGAVDENLRN